MDLSKIKALIDFVGQSNVSELAVTEKDVTVRIFRNHPSGHASSTPTNAAAVATTSESAIAQTPAAAVPVKAPVFGVLHRAPAPGEPPFVKLGDAVEAGQTLFVIEAMKVFNTISAPRSGRIVHLTDIDGGEVETGNLLAEIA
ncbi:acetyl-CoA carboxylase biotin carboxyl carrier protein [Neorhizobium galegae]|uniref:acetyl-CoA carboxylase biotin carboxyl carrier protein n=1 Tax=Neorhizobium galegae TaxID=399 RepID=UPI001AE4205A|nr:acetyl-CoA carboxylase biotin carboxyl carrier protein subunit [Neorhizobium galegae]MBP2551653.1 acetyl-CoA carboxylase biotin carboxyl carrier protein [Neorhizobium galegae]